MQQNPRWSSGDSKSECRNSEFWFESRFQLHGGLQHNVVVVVVVADADADVDTDVDADADVDTDADVDES